MHREKELHQEILTFSISHDHRSVRIYGHYAIIGKDKTTYYHHPIHAFDFRFAEAKWAAYRSTKNVYDHWMPIYLKKICSAIDDLPSNINFDLSQSASFSQSGSESSQQYYAKSTLMPNRDDSQSSFVMGSQEVIPTTAVSSKVERASKKPRNQRALDQQR